VIGATAREHAAGGPRDPVNDLYDHGCDLVEAARAMRRGAGRPGVARAAPAVAGCLETALHDLAGAADELERLGPPATFAGLALALREAAGAAAAARALAARARAGGRRA
jgi:hypothetical protein